MFCARKHDLKPPAVISEQHRILDSRVKRCGERSGLTFSQVCDLYWRLETRRKRLSTLGRIEVEILIWAELVKAHLRQMEPRSRVSTKHPFSPPLKQRKGANALAQVRTVTIHSHHLTAPQIYEKLLVKLVTTSLSLVSNSLLSAPSLSIFSSISLSLLLMWLRKSASHCRILPTGTLSR